MELITYPFSLFVGALLVLFLAYPFLFLGYKGAQKYVEFLTKGRYELKTFVDKALYTGWGNLRQPYEAALITTSVLCFIIAFISGLETSVGKGTFLENLVFFSFSTPVEFIATISPVLFPVFVLFLASFGMRKLVSIGYDVNERLVKVEKS